MTWHRLHLPADGPGEWLSTHVCTHLSATDRAGAVPTADLTDGGWLLDAFERSVAGGTPRAYAATQLAAAFGGTIGMELGYAHVGAGAGFLPDPATTTWVLGESWAEGIVLPADTRAVVLADHPWAGRADVDVVDADELARRTIEAIALLAEPIIDHLARATRTGRAGLWHEVGDAVPSVLEWQSFPVGADAVRDVVAMAGRVGVPWRRGPVVELMEEGGASTCVKHRAGCCMKYLERRDRTAPRDADKAAFWEAFPAADPERMYCNDCKFFTDDERRDRQLWWFRRHQAAASPP